MKNNYIFFVILLFSMQSLHAAPATQNKPNQVLQYLNNPVGLNALRSFSGIETHGKKGAMVKLGLDLSLVYQEHRDFNIKGGASLLRRSFKSSLKNVRVKNEKIVIDVVATSDVGTLVAQLEVLGMENISVYGRMISGLMPISSLEQTAAISAIRLARPSYASLNTGSVTSQGDAALLSDDARLAFGVDGTGITIGTLSDSYDCLGGAATGVASNDLPTGVVVLADETGCNSGTDEGRAMMEIVHDVAPGANQAFYSAFNGEAAFANGILDLANIAGASVINDDVIYFAEPMFQDGVIAQAIDTVKAQGVAYFSAAGNSSANSYQASFVDSGVAGNFSGSTRHDFDSGAGTDTLMSITVPENSNVTIILQWDDPFFSVSGAPGADTDMDILLYSATGTAITGGTNNNIGGDAVEIMQFTSDNVPGAVTTVNYQLGIEHFAGPFPGIVKFVYFGSVTINEFNTYSATSFGHPIAAGGNGVGAARYSQTPDFGVSPPVRESFSSKGGVPILFDTSGNPINDVRQKPDFVAPDGGDNTFFGSDYEGNGSPNFFGTSAAAPHAAGMAALLREFDSNLTPDDVSAVMRNTAVDMQTAGYDVFTGYGLVQATLALSSLDLDGDLIPNSQDNCPNTPNFTQDDFDNDSLGDACDADDDNDGVDDGADSDPLNAFICEDTDADTCDDCSIAGFSAPNNDGVDTDSDGLCDLGDNDIDGDNVINGLDSDPLNAFVCLDIDADTCDDCSILGVADISNDGTDTDADGLCDLGDGDDDNDGLLDVDEPTYGTNPLLDDTDGDGFSDGDEVAAGSDPTNNLSIPGVTTGDINGDGTVDVVDVLLATRISVGELIPTTNQLLRGDIAPEITSVYTPDGVINAGDLLLIKAIVLGP